MPRRGGHDASLDYHRRMIEDVHRMDAYDRALRARVRPGDVVLDVGCGTGILAMMAARAGAARVHAVESMPVARLARELVAANGLTGRVFVHEADAAEMVPLEPVDVVVSDFMGRFVVDDAMLDAVAAAGRWLRPGGVFVPERVRLRVAPAGGFRMPALEWVEAVVGGIDLRALAPHVLNANYGAELHGHALLAEAQDAGAMVPPAAPVLGGRLSFTVARAETLRGLAGWFEATLAPGIVLSTAPDVETHWGQVLFPLPPLAVAAGDVIEAELRLVEEEQWEYEWDVTVRRGGTLLLEERLDTRWRPGERPAPPARVVDPEGDDAEEINERGAEAYAAGRLGEALRLWEDAVRALPPGGGELAAPIHENLGIAYLQHGQPIAAAGAFLRALDGDPRSRRQSRRLLNAALHGAGKHIDARRLERIDEEEERS